MNKIFTPIALFFIFSCASAFAQYATSIFKHRFSSMVAIAATDRDGNRFGQGAGFFIGKNLVADKLIAYCDEGHPFSTADETQGKSPRIYVAREENTSKLSNTKDTNPCADNLEQYQKKALNKVHDLEGYMMKISNRQTNAIDARNAVNLAVKLFTGEDRTVEVSSTKRTTKDLYQIREYLKRMRILPYDNVRVSWSNISYISNLRKGMDGNYYGTISFDQLFEGMKDGKVTYRDRTRKNVEVVLKSQNIYSNGQEIPYCDIFLSDIGVVSTQ